MFQYALGVTLKKRNRRTVLISRVDLTDVKTFYLPYYFELDPIHSIMTSGSFLRGKIFDAFTSRIIPRLLEKDEDQLNGSCDKVFIKGFFQSEEYFKDAESQVRKAFTIREKHVRQYLKKYSKPDSNTAVIHVRLGDYKEFGDQKLGGADLTLPLSYYQAQMDKLRSIGVNKFLFVSDDIEETQMVFGMSKNYTYSNGTVIQDFLHLKYATFAIISNSTFAWWACYLNENPKKQIIAPKHWLGFKVGKEYPKGISTKSFEWTEVW